jgi:hypothetical protein
MLADNNSICQQFQSVRLELARNALLALGRYLLRTQAARDVVFRVLDVHRVHSQRVPNLGFPLLQLQKQLFVVLVGLLAKEVTGDVSGLVAWLRPPAVSRQDGVRMPCPPDAGRVVPDKLTPDLGYARLVVEDAVDFQDPLQFPCQLEVLLAFLLLCKLLKLGLIRDRAQTLFLHFFSSHQSAQALQCILVVKLHATAQLLKKTR